MSTLLRGAQTFLWERWEELLFDLIDEMCIYGMYIYLKGVRFLWNFWVKSYVRKKYGNPKVLYIFT